MNRNSIRNYGLPLVLIAAILALDIVTKQAIVRDFSFGERSDFLGGFLRLSLVYNEGGVFGILQGHKNLFLVVSIIVLTLMMIYYLLRKTRPFFSASRWPASCPGLWVILSTALFRAGRASLISYPLA